MDNFGVIFLGPPGAGKGTQADIIEEKLSIKKISTGDILREAVRKGTELGKLAESYMNRGELVPDDVMLSLIEETLKNINGGFILDGFPRTLEQARGLDRLLEKLNIPLKVVVLLDLEDEKIIRRLSARRICPNCGAVYNMLSNPPEEDEVCDRCGTKLITRDDDKPDVIRRRLEVYRRSTEPLIDYYKKRGILERIHADGTPEEIAEKIIPLLR